MEVGVNSLGVVASVGASYLELVDLVGPLEYSFVVVACLVELGLF